MRDFSEADRKKKDIRIQIQENPGNLSKEQVSHLEEKIKSSLKDGYLPCTVALGIAKEADIPKIAVGEVADRLGIRITNCQIGCFKIEKTPYDKAVHKNIADGNIIAMLETLGENNELTCAKLFELAGQLKLTPMAVADVANIRNLKIHHCQLGCF